MREDGGLVLGLELVLQDDVGLDALLLPVQWHAAPQRHMRKHVIMTNEDLLSLYKVRHMISIIQASVVEPCA